MDKGAYRIFLFVLIFSPLAFGTVEHWSLAGMECLVALAALALFMGRAREKEPLLHEVPGIVPLACLWAYMALQVVPLPQALVRLISPETYNIYKETVTVLEPSAWLSLSVNKKGTVLELLRFTSYALFYVLTVELMTAGGLLKRTVAVVVVFASLLSFMSILQHFLVPERVLWFRPLTNGGTPFGPYVNRNHYAGFMGMILPVVVGLLLVYKPRVRYKGIRAKVAEVFSQPRTNVHILLILAAVVIGTSVFITLSRGGIISVCLSMACMGLLLLRRERRRGVLIILLFALLFFSVGWFGWEHIFERFGRLRDEAGRLSDLRLDIWRDSLDIIRRFPLFGVGFGGFVNVSKGFGSVPAGYIVNHAHNDYLELLAEGGVVAFVLASWFVASVLGRTMRALSRRIEPYSVFLSMGSVAGIISILMHGFVDFNMQIGANGLYFFFLSGLAVSAANTRLRRGFGRTYLGKVERRLPGRLVAAAGLFLALTFVLNLGIFIGRACFSPLEGIRLGEETSKEELERIRVSARWASAFDPLEARYRYARANAGMLLSDKEAALGHYIDAIRLDPLNGEYLQRIGLVFSMSRDDETADRLLKAGIKHDPVNPARDRQYALWLLSRGEREGGLSHLGHGISLEPDRTREYLTLVVLHGFSRREMFGAMPRLARPYLGLGDFLLDVGEDEMAEEAYLKALEFVGSEEAIRPLYFYKVYGYYAKRGRYEDALGVMRKAAEFLPRNAGIRVTMGSLYERAGITYRAVEEFERALMIDPGNRAARNGLKRLNAARGGL